MSFPPLLLVFKDETQLLTAPVQANILEDHLAGYQESSVDASGRFRPIPTKCLPALAAPAVPASALVVPVPAAVARTEQIDVAP